MRRHAALFFKASNRRRGDWNTLLLVMFAVLAVAPSMLAATPLQGLNGAASQPQAMWQWLQSPAGAPTRETLHGLLAQAYELDGFPDLPPAEMAAVIAALQRTPHLKATTAVELPQQLAAPPQADGELDGKRLRTSRTSFWAFHATSPVAATSARRTFARVAQAMALSPHQAAFLSGTRNNRRHE